MRTDPEHAGSLDMRPLRIRIITGDDKPFAPKYLMYRLADLWREDGHTVSVGLTSTLEADLAIMHVDLTVMQNDHVPDNPDHRPMINGCVLDISKVRISRQRVLQGDAHAGPVIVKSNFNAFGSKEYRALGRWSGARIRRRLSKVLPWRWVGCLPKQDYPILDDISQVPHWVWGRSDLIVERFVPERDGDDYVLRCWLFFGEQEYSVKLFSRHPVVKVANIYRHEYLHEVPDSLRETRRALGFDFGKFDYVMVDGQAILLDANKTPTIAGTSRTPNLLRLAKGLSGFVAKGAA